MAADYRARLLAGSLVTMSYPSPSPGLLNLTDRDETARKRLQGRDRSFQNEQATAWLTVDAGRGPRRGMR